jgi:hypothetical protein
MPRSVNKVILVGNVGKDPEVRYSQRHSGHEFQPRYQRKVQRPKQRMARADRVAQHRGVATSGGDRWGVRCQRLQGIRRRQAPDHKLGGSAGRGEEIPHGDCRPRLAPARPAGKHRARPTRSDPQRKRGPALPRWLRRNCGPGYSILKRLGDSCTSLRRESCHDPSQRTRQ